MKDPLLYILHIHECLQKIFADTRDGRDAFMSDPKTQDAVVRNFEVIGEAARRLQAEFTVLYPQVPWRRMAGFRDILIHACDRADMGEIWNIIEQHLAELLSEIENIRRGIEH